MQIIDPWGKILAECPTYTEDGAETDASVAVATIDPEEVSNARYLMPVFQHRRHDLYEVNMLKIEEESAVDDEDHYMFADKTIPASTVFYKTAHSFAFTNIRCVVPGRILVILNLQHCFYFFS